MPTSVLSQPIKLAGISIELPARSAPPYERVHIIQNLHRSLLGKVQEISKRLGHERYAVIENDVFETSDVPRLWSMVAVTSYDDIPDWCERYIIKPGRYAMFEHIGFPKELSKTVTRIHIEWSEHLPGLFQTNLEVMVYPPGYDPLDPQGKFGYWLPLS